MCFCCLELPSQWLLSHGESSAWRPSFYIIENSPNPSLKQSIECFCSFHFPIIFFFLLYLQTLIFLAENRKPYQIGITVLLAIVFSPKTGWLWASSESHLLCTHRPIRSQKKKTKKGESPGLLILKQRVVAWELHAFDKGWPRGHVHDREQRVWGALHYSWWPCWPCLCYP